MLQRLSIILPLLLSGAAVAQDGSAGDVAFTLRPTQDAPVVDDYGPGRQAEPEAYPGETTVGPAMAGPTADDPIGPPLRGPEPQAREDVPAPARRERSDPFEARGFDVGAFVIRPAIEVGVAATDDAAGRGDAAIGMIVSPELAVTTGPGKYTLDAEARANAIFYGDEAIDEQDAEARIALDYEPTRSTRLEAEASYAFSRDSYTDPDTPDDATKRPGVHEFEASLAATQRLGRVAFTMRGAVERSVHENVRLEGGGTAELDVQDNLASSVALRASYDAGALSPFVEAEVGRRDYDETFDADGYKRSSRWASVSGGVTIDMGPKLSGEIAAGYYREVADDDRLEPIDGVEVAASLIWSPRRLTEVRVDLATSVEPTTIAGSPGSLVYSGDVVVTRLIGSGWRVEGGAGIDHERYIGVAQTETTYRGFVGTSYAINRNLSVAARVSHERVESSEPDDDSRENAVEVRLRVQY